ncbi:hypothetical protein [Frankia sp. AgKG'84/4]|uniref:hypothetical protein n=1 Tax=Frankia sp. AgKG'84/4 TaxID=573490 RepID=UPI00200CCBB5|nr:hypothetical protein [Frankia sp. AgKG'84/4]MCL9795082.1 hypothetical protein [Frankia sp. AgKG'84/4]
MDADPLLTVTEIADRLRLTASSWRASVADGSAPKPDDPDDGKEPHRRRPRWRRSTVDAWNAQRRHRFRPAGSAPGPGATETG